MSFSVTFPEKDVKSLTYTRLRENVPVEPPTQRDFPSNTPLRVPVFTYNGTQYVLIKHLAALWNYPSSYQVVTHLTRRLGLTKQDLLQTSDEALNELLAENGVILPPEQKTMLFYVNLEKLCLILPEKGSIFALSEPADLPLQSKPPLPPLDEELITILQVFPNYGSVEESLPLTHATFLLLTPLTKLHVYKHEGNYRKVYGTSLSAHERELVTAASNYSQAEITAPAMDAEAEKKQRRALGRQKKFVGNVDPNQLDVAENVLPGCGYIPEFNVNLICKVPTYYVTNKEMGAQYSAFHSLARLHLAGLATKGKKPLDMPKQLYQLLSSTDQEAHYFKYYYFKSYRGPGSGNYKDAALVNRINKIRRFPSDLAPQTNASTHLLAARVTKPQKRGDLAIKGLVHDHFSGENVDIVVERQRQFVEDFENMEMLHNNALFNLLVNSYRDVAKDTWDAFYKFKMIDFEKKYLKQRNESLQQKKDELLQQQVEGNLTARAQLAELNKADLNARFLLPSDYTEIMEKLPCELRGDDSDPDTGLSEPVRYLARYPDKNAPGMLNQVEVIKLPNANSIAWDNIKKYRRP